MVFQYIERTAIPAWGPQQSESLIAAGTVAGAMDATFSNTSELEIFRLGATDDTAGALESIGKVEAAARFQRLAWSGKSGSHDLGVVAGGLENGDVAVWDPARIIAGEDNAVLHASSAHTGAVGGLEFNPFQTNLMASGATNGEVFVWDIVSEFKSYSPGARSQRIDSVTDLAWNNQVQHILATASNTGSLVVWDLKSRREVIALSSPGAIGSTATGRGGISACAWNPASATQLVTASSDDSNPAIMLWDLRNANAPSQVFTGHHRGVLSLSWCRKDAGLLLSSGKDNRTVCWNPMTGEIVGELPPSSNWVYDVQWNQSNPNLLSGASFDGRVNLYSLARESESVESSVSVNDDPFAPQSSTAFAPSLSLKRPPKWLARPCGAVFGFGGQLVRFSQGSGSMVSIDELVSEPELAQQARQLTELLENDQAAELCRERLQQSKGSDQERSWQVLEILFDPSARDKLIRFLGFDKAEVKQRIAELLNARRAAEAATSEPEIEAEAEKSEQEEEEAEPEGAESVSASVEDNPFAGSVSADADAEDFFSKPIETPTAPGDSTAATVGSAAPTEIIESAADADIRALRVAFSGAFHIYDKAKDIASEDADGLITRAVLLGDIEAAVELCIEKELFADALILATCGSADLASRAQQAYFAKRAQQASYVRLLHSIVTNDLTDVVANGDLGEWDEILALLCTYAQGDQFSNLCELLGRRLERANELSNAVLCYLASGNLDKVAAIWVSRENGAVGHERVQRLHGLLEKVAVFRKAVQFVDPALDPEYTGPFPLAPLYDSYIEYARFLVSQGLFDIASKYLERTPAAYKYYLPTGEDGLATLRDLVDGSNAQQAPWTLEQVGADYSKSAPQPVQQQQQQQQQPQIYQQYSSYAPASGGMGYPQTSMPAVQHYNATGSSMYPAASAAYSGMAQGYPAVAPPPALQPHQQQQPQQQQPSMFPPPPQPLNPASIPTGNTPPPRREDTAWNDPPMVSKPAKRAPASAIKPAAIVSPFPQGRNTPPPPPPGAAAAGAFGSARSPVAGASAVPPPPRTGFMSAGSPAAPASMKPLPPAPQMAFPNAQHAPQTMQPQQPFQPMQQPGFVPPASANPAMGTAASAPMQQSMQPMRGQVVSSAAAAGSTGAGANSRSNTPATLAAAASLSGVAKTSKYPEGDRSHIPSEWAPIFNGLNTQVQRAKQFAAPAQKRMVDDAQRRLNLLFDLMNCDEIKMKDKLCPVFEHLLQSINSRQFPQALHYQAELMTINSDITTHLVGVKHLINVLKTLPM
ncbi:protein transport protein S31 [Coemansia asiatica]|uniref:Protein transport protein SEC31 n=1 Tax=Coemansia asiatica TaxID=1052880 RepID=A0A9W8CGH8_9FUNG|nr:protein transport protein S31 [Coemansia asiatica]